MRSAGVLLSNWLGTQSWCSYSWEHERWVNPTSVFWSDGFFKEQEKPSTLFWSYIATWKEKRNPFQQINVKHDHCTVWCQSYKEDHDVESLCKSNWVLWLSKVFISQVVLKIFHFTELGSVSKNKAEFWHSKYFSKSNYLAILNKGYFFSHPLQSILGFFISVVALA